MASNYKLVVDYGNDFSIYRFESEEAMEYHMYEYAECGEYSWYDTSTVEGAVAYLDKLIELVHRTFLE